MDIHAIIDEVAPLFVELGQADFVEDVRELVDHNEPAIAIEALCDNLSECDIVITAATRDRLHAAVLAFGADIARFLPIRVGDP